jgi:hypothetical protein
MSVPNSEKARYFGRVFFYLRLYRKYRERTMVPALAYAENMALIARALDDPALDGGAIIECGTWRGGMSAGMIEVGGPARQYFFLFVRGDAAGAGTRRSKAIKWQSAPAARRFGYL